MRVALNNACTLPDERVVESRQVAEGAGLNFSADCMEGIRRRGTPGAFYYEQDDGRRVAAADLRRIAELAIPPAWTDVWICSDALGHLQVTGRDARGRKQYRYHARWRSVRDETKYERLLEFGDALPGIRRQIDADLRRPNVDYQRVMALVVGLMDESLVRVGNAEYARANSSFGLTTLRDEHAEVGVSSVRLRFRGKAGKELTRVIENPRLARALRRVRDLPGQELFQYVDDNGQQRVIGSGDVNAYLQLLSGADVTSKDFRTWGATVVVAASLHEASPPVSGRAVAEAVRQASQVLGNTPAVCRKSYVHPGIIELYLAGELDDLWERARQEEPYDDHLREDERIVLGVLRELLRRDERDGGLR